MGRYPYRDGYMGYGYGRANYYTGGYGRGGYGYGYGPGRGYGPMAYCSPRAGNFYAQQRENDWHHAHDPVGRYYPRVVYRDWDDCRRRDWDDRRRGRDWDDRRRGRDWDDEGWENW